MTLPLSTLKPFAQGGNRLCFVHPNHPDRCIKVRRPDFSLADSRRKKGFPKKLKPLSSFDDNREEFRVMTNFQRRYGDRIFQHVSRCYGFTDTDLGAGLVSELIRDADGAISETLKKYLWDNGLTEDCEKAVSQLGHFWQSEAVPSRDLLLHNIVVQKGSDGQIIRLVVIDGLGSAGLIPFHWLPDAVQHHKAGRKVTNLHKRIQDLLNQRGQSEFPGYHGLLLHDGRAQGKDLSPENQEHTEPHGDKTSS